MSVPPDLSNVVPLELTTEDKSKQTASNEQEFVKTLYQKHWRELCLRLRKVFSYQNSDAEDLAQAAFARISEIDDYQKINHPKAFLFKTAVNLGLNANERRQTVNRFVEQALAEANEPLIEENSPEDMYSMQQRLNQLEQYMDRLTDKQKHIIQRSRLHGETYAQISADTGWSQADISRQLNQALQQLQLGLNKDGEV